MKFWNLFGEFLLFKWLFGSGHDDVFSQHTSDTFHNCADDEDYSGIPHSYYDDCESPQSYNDFLDEQDDYDMFDNDDF